MKKNDLRAMITQEITRAQLIEAMKADTQENTKQGLSADQILEEYTSLVRDLATESKITVKEANTIVSNALRNGGKIELDESSGVVISEGFFSRLGGFYKDVFQAAANAFDPNAGQKVIPQPEKVQQAAKAADDPQEMMALLKQILAAVQQADQAEEGGTPEEEAAEDEVVAAVEDEVEAIAGEIEGGELTGDDAAQPGEAPAPGEEGEAAAEGPVPLFKGDGALYSRLFSSIRDRLKSDPNYGELASDKKAIEGAVKSILKDLSAQLRVNGIKVTESQVPLLSALIAERIRSGRYNIISERDTSLGGGALPGVTDAGGGQAGPSDDEIRKKEKKQKFQPGGNATQKPTGKGGRVKPVKGQVSAGQAVAGKIHDMIAQQLGGGSPDDMKQIRKDTQKMVTTIITKMVKPFLEKYLAGKDIKLKEGQFSDLTILLTDKVLTEAIKRRQLRK